MAYPFLSRELTASQHRHDMPPLSPSPTFAHYSETHPDYRIEVSSPRGKPIRVGSAWMAKSSRTGNDYLSLLINTPDGDLRVNAVQNEEQRGGQTFSIIPFIDSGEQPQDAGAGLSLVA